MSENIKLRLKIRFPVNGTIRSKGFEWEITKTKAKYFLSRKIAEQVKEEKGQSNNK